MASETLAITSTGFAFTLAPNPFSKKGGNFKKLPPKKNSDYIIPPTLKNEEPKRGNLFHDRLSLEGKEALLTTANC